MDFRINQELGTQHALASQDQDSLRSFSAQFTVLNAFLFKGALRKFQHDIFRHGGFEVCPPFSATPIRIARSIVVKRNELWLGAFSEYTQQELWLLNGSFTEGFPLITALVITRRGELIDAQYLRILHNKSNDSRVIKDKIRRFLHVRAKTMISWGRTVRPELAIGHINFAHHAWNELPAFIRLMPQIGDTLTACKRILSEHEPILPLLELFPEIPVGMLKRSSEAANLHRHDAFIFRVGSTLFTTEVKLKVQSAAKAARREPAIDALATRLSDKAVRMVWITIRLTNRTSVNQVSFLQALIRHLALSWQNAVFVLNGFSFPYEAQINSLVRQRFTPLVAAIERTCCEVISGLEPASLGQRVFSVNGYALLDTIFLASSADFYVAHPGTIHHKVGWMWKTPGILLAPKNCKRIAGWYARSVEDSIEPYCLCSSLYRVVPRCGRIPDRNDFYRIENVDAAVASIADLAAPYLS